MGLLSRARFLVLAAVLFGVLAAGRNGLCAGEQPSATGNQLCALFVERLVKYVTWPPQTDQQGGEALIVAATDARRIRPFFAEIASSPRLRVVQWPVPDCRILLLNGTPPREAAAIVHSVAELPILTVGYGLEGPPEGLVVNIREIAGRLKLEINPAAARRAGLTLSSRLLQIAIVTDGN